MADGCAGSCIMADRIKAIEQREISRDQQYIVDQKSKAEEDKTNAKWQARMETTLSQLVDESKSTNQMMSGFLQTQQKEAIEKARNINKEPASKWNSLSKEAKGIIKSLFLLFAGAVITYLFSKII